MAVHDMVHKYPKIGRFCDAVKEIRLRHDYTGKDSDGNATYKHTTPYPTVRFRGTVKLHGTNASIEMTDESIYARSRNRVLSVGDDQYGFAAFVTDLPPRVIELLWKPHHIVYGEWCGKGIQSGVAINQLEKMFVIFAVYNTETSSWSDAVGFNADEQALLNMFRIHTIQEFGMYVLDVDFNEPEKYENKLAALSESVYECCPVGRCMGVDGHGEGVVWVSQICDGYTARFKVKSDKLAATRTPQAKADPEKVATIAAFANMTVTDNRVDQGVQEICGVGSPDRKRTGAFVKWVLHDVISEEDAIIKGSGLSEAEVRKAITSVAAKRWLTLCDKAS